MSRRKILYIISFLMISLLLVGSSYADEVGKEPWKGAYTTEQFADGAIRKVYCDLVGYVGGSFGGLLFSVAGLVAIAMGVFGEGRQSKNVLVVGIGAFSISAAVSLYFGDLGCGTGGQTGRTAKSEESVTAKEFSLPYFSESKGDAPKSAEVEEGDAELF